MKSILFRNRISIQAPASKIYAYLMEPRNLPQLHPLIIGVKTLPSTSSGSVRVEIQDKMKLMGLIPLYKKYEASFTSIEQDRRLVLETFTSPGIHIKNTITLTESESGTEVEEQVLVEVPSWIAGFVIKQIEFSHGEMLRTLKITLEIVEK
jgi:ligand-binding SRPBCC domain-containing protein